MPSDADCSWSRTGGSSKQRTPISPTSNRLAEPCEHFARFWNVHERSVCIPLLPEQHSAHGTANPGLCDPDHGGIGGRVVYSMLMPKVLIVEDNEMNRDMLSRRLARRGLVVVMAVDGAEGVAMSKTELPDIF